MIEHYDDPLFSAILENDVEKIERLKAQGVELSDNVKNMLSIKRFDFLNTNACRHEIDCDFQCAVRPMGAEDLIKTIRALRNEIGETLFFMPAIWTDIKKIMFEDGVWECVLECLDHKMNKAQAMRDIIKANRADLLAVCAKHGWLSQPKKRNEMIQYSSDKHKTECTAWLLEFKKNNFDLAAEREKAEKKAERELNAAPDSVTALKQIWSYKKQEDADRTSAQGRQKAAGCRQQSDLGGSLIITGYKGNRTDVIVPEKIGKNTVTAIGDSAFCPFAPRVTPEIKEARKAITKITLPKTVQSIGRRAFWGCEELVSVNIPDGVEFIGERTFTECGKLKKITIPNSVKHIGVGAFFKCGSLRIIEVPEGVEEIDEQAFSMCGELISLVLPASLKNIFRYGIVSITDKFVGAVVPPGSYAEEYCKKHNIPFSDKLVEVEPDSPAEEYCKQHKRPYAYKEDKTE